MLLPHAIPARRNRSARPIQLHTILIVLVTAVPSFFLGTLSCMFYSLDCTNSSSSGSSSGSIERRVQERVKVLESQLLKTQSFQVEQLVQARMKDLDEECHNSGELNGDRSDALSRFLDADRVGKFVAGMVRTPKADFTSFFDLGVPVDEPKAGAEDVLLLYTHKALPSKSTVLPEVMTVPQAVENCDYLNVVLTDSSGTRRQCVAIVPQYESYHIQKWMRVNKISGKLDSKGGSLSLVGRGQQATGRDSFVPPDLEHTEKNWGMLRNYLDSLDGVLGDLKEILERIAIDNTVIVMVCNFGQAELLMNFVCAAKSRGLNLSNTLVFTTDEETTELAQSLGLNAYYDKRVRSLLFLFVAVSLRCTRAFVHWLTEAQNLSFFCRCRRCRCRYGRTELWRHSDRGSATLRRSQVCGHDDGQGHLCAARFHARLRFPLSRCRYRLVQEPANLFYQYFQSGLSLRHFFSRRRRSFGPLRSLFGQFGFLLCPPQRADTALFDVAVNVGRFDPQNQVTPASPHCLAERACLVVRDARQGLVAGYRRIPRRLPVEHENGQVHARFFCGRVASVHFSHELDPE
jgi:hypothetical protein